MSAPAPTASGDRSVVVGGDIVGSVIVTGDNVQIKVGAGGVGGTLLDLLGWRRVKKRARPTPLDVRPAPFEDRLDREAEVAALVASDAGRLSVVGEALVGKTYVVRAALAEAVAHAPADGIVCLRGRGRALEDLLQAFWEELYETRPPTKPSARELREDLAEREALFVVDDAEVEHGDAQALADSLPRSRLILVSRQRRLWDGIELTIAGLPPDASLAMFKRDLGRPLAAGEREAASAVFVAVGGHPQRLRQAAGIIARGAQTLEQLAASLSGSADIARPAIAAATESEQDVLAALEPFGDGPVGGTQIEALAGPGGEKAAEALVRHGVAISHGSSYSLAVDLGVALDDDRLEAARSRAVDHIARLAEDHPEKLGDDLPAALSLLRRAADLGRWQDVLRLGQALAPALVLERRFGAWGQAADLVHEAAQRLDDVGARAWALHERGTRALCNEDPSGKAVLQEALELRERIGDERGAAATRHNLRLPAGPPWYLRRIVHLPVIVLLISLVVLVSAGGAALVKLDKDDDGSGGTQLGQNTLGIAVVGDGTVTAGSAAPCSESCERDFGDDQQVELDATPADGWQFSGWSGDCSGNDCTVSLDQDRNVTATFVEGDGTELGQNTLGIVVIGEGTVAAGSAVPCSESCERDFDDDQQLELDATPASGWQFSGWSGDCSGDQCTVSLDQDRNVTATFAEGDGTESGQNTLGIAVIGEGTVAAGSANPCSESCERDFGDDQQVELDATPAEGWQFSGWSGDCSGDQCTVSLDQDRNVTATFAESPDDGGHVLTVELAEGGTIMSEPSGITCPTDCTERFTRSVTLRATADDGWRLSDWGREGCDPTGDCLVDLSADVTVRPVFIRLVALEIVVADGGTVSFADGSGTTLVCPKNCSATYPAGETVKLSAAPSDGYADPDWQRNGCPQGPDCTVELDADTTVTPVFARLLRLLELTLTGKGTGAVSSDDPPFECRGRRCTEQVVDGSTVRLVAVPAGDSELESWGGDAKNCASSLDCSIVIDESPAVTAIFMPKPRLTVTVNGPIGSGVVSSPAGIDCERTNVARRTGAGTCTALFARGTPVILRPTPPSDDVYLSRWEGACSGSKRCRVPMTGYGDYSVTANFSRAEG